jgi:hypothetical protein
VNDELDRITQAGRTPHGYTLAIWAAGMFCITKSGLPDAMDVLLFTGGATLAFGFVRLIASQLRPSADCAEPSPRVRGASVHVIALPGVVLASWAAAFVPDPWCWPTTASAATIAFILLHGGQDVIARRWRAICFRSPSAPRRA